MALPIDLVHDTDCTVAVEIKNAAGHVIRTEHVTTIKCLPYIVQDVVFWLLVFAGIVAVVLIIVGGIKFITSGGDPKSADGARKTITYAILGLVLVLFSFAIVAFIAKTTGVKRITKFGFPECTTNADCDAGYYCDQAAGVCRPH